MRDYQIKSNEGGIADSITSTKLGANEANSFLTEAKTAVSTSGQTLANASGTSESTDQLAKALAIYGGGGGEYCVDTGSANAYVLAPVSPKKAIPALFDGMMITFRPGNTNTGASTINYNSIGVKSLTKLDGSALSANDLGEYPVRVIFNSSSDRFEVVSGGVPYLQTVYTSNGTHTPTGGCKAIKFTATGGGGSGGGTDGQGGGTIAMATGGGGGGTCYLTTTVIDSSYAIVVGSGGIAPAAGANNGNAGTASTVTSTNVSISAGGGLGGLGVTGSGTNTQTAGVAGGTATGGDININGSQSTDSFAVAGNPGGPSFSGMSVWGGGVTTNGVATGPGSGGPGALSWDVVTDFAGGPGEDGIVIIEEWF